MKVSVFVKSIVATEYGGSAVVEASNGSSGGPPFLRFELRGLDKIKECYVGKRYDLTIEEA